MNLILASKSPRRQQLMRLLGLPFRVMTEDVDETMDPALPPEDEVARVSRKKAEAVLPLVGADALVVCADTIVVLDGRILGKPADREEAGAMLRALSGKTHTVLTAVTVCTRGQSKTEVERTEVSFRPLSCREIDAYVATGEPMDKAGAYGIQGFGSVFVRRLNGDYFNVMGLPVCRLTGLLRQFGVSILGEDENT